MHIAVLGTGMVGQAIAGRLDDLGHTVVIGEEKAGADQRAMHSPRNAGTVKSRAAFFPRRNSPRAR